MKKISIIIPVYNVEKFVERCVMSCIHQNILSDEYEIILVNDGSKDNSLSIIEGLAEKYSNIMVYSQENQGLSGARNTGLRQATGEYVWFIDSDDWIQENCIKKVTDVCFQRKLDMLQICAANMYNDKIMRRFSYSDEESIFSGVEALNRGIPFCAPFSIYRRDFLEQHKLSFYPGIFHEDNEFSPRAYYYAERVSSLNDLLYYVYQNPNSITRTVNPKKAFDCIIVMNSLHDFMTGMKEEAKLSFHRLITGTFNAAIHDTIEISKEDVNRFNDELCKNRHLYIHLLKSGKWMYQLEGVLLKLFPNSPIKIYHLMNYFDRRRIKK